MDEKKFYKTYLEVINESGGPIPISAHRNWVASCGDIEK